MKILVAAMALAVAFPAAAQTAPAQHPVGHQAAGHDTHGGHSAQAGHGEHQAQGAHQGGCCADRDGNGRMDCCERGMCAEHRQTPGAQPSGQ